MEKLDHELESHIYISPGIGGGERWWGGGVCCGGPSDSVKPRPALYGSLLAWLVAYNRTSEPWLSSTTLPGSVSMRITVPAGLPVHWQGETIEYSLLRCIVDPLLILNRQDQLKSQRNSSRAWPSSGRVPGRAGQRTSESHPLRPFGMQRSLRAAPWY